MYKLVLVVNIRTCTDLSFKMAVHNLHLEASQKWNRLLKKLILNPFLWLGAVFGVANVLMWCSSLKDYDLSYAYPFLSISYITIILSGKLFFNENLDKNKIWGLFFIGAGAGALFLG